VPKAEELVATAYRHGSKEKAEAFFLDGMTRAMHRLAEQAHPAFPVTIYYASNSQRRRVLKVRQAQVGKRFSMRCSAPVLPLQVLGRCGRSWTAA